MTAKILDFEARAKARSVPCRHSPPWAIDSRDRVMCQDCGRTLSQVEAIRVLAGNHCNSIVCFIIKVVFTIYRLQRKSYNRALL